MMIYAGIFSCFEVTRRHSRKYSRSSGSTPDAAPALATEFSRLFADPHHPEPGVLAAAADALAGNSFSWPKPGRGPRVKVIEAVAAAAAERSVAERLARRLDFCTAPGALSHPISYPHTSQAPHDDHFGVSPKCKQICRCRQRVESTKARMM